MNDRILQDFIKFGQQKRLELELKAERARDKIKALCAEYDDKEKKKQEGQMDDKKGLNGKTGKKATHKVIHPSCIIIVHLGRYEYEVKSTCKYFVSIFSRFVVLCSGYMDQSLSKTQ